MTFTKMDLVDLDSSHQELSNGGGLKIVVALLVRWKIIFFVGSYWTSNPAVVDVYILHICILYAVCLG